MRGGRLVAMSRRRSAGADIHSQVFFQPSALLHSRILLPYAPLSTDYLISVTDSCSTAQQIFQVVWLYRLWKIDPRKSEKDRKEAEQLVDFVPYYAVGNICIGVWMFFWNSSHLKTANVFVIINTCTQLFYMMNKLPTLNTSSTSSILTHVVSKTFAGIGVLDILHNTSVAYFKDMPATSLVKALTGVGFIAASAVSDWIFGGCLVYDLVALAAGQSGGWRSLLGVYAVACTGVVAAKNLTR